MVYTRSEGRPVWGAGAGPPAPPPRLPCERLCSNQVTHARAVVGRRLRAKPLRPICYSMLPHGSGPPCLDLLGVFPSTAPAVFRPGDLHVYVVVVGVGGSSPFCCPLRGSPAAARASRTPTPSQGTHGNVPMATHLGCGLEPNQAQAVGKWFL